MGDRTREGLDRLRPLVTRLDASAPAGENARALQEAWEGAADVLRAVSGNSASLGAELVMTCRQRGTLSMEQAHSLIDLYDTATRAAAPGYQPDARDLNAARAALNQLDAALAPAPVSSRGAAAATPVLPPPAVTMTEPSWRGPGRAVALGVALLALGIGGWATYRWYTGPRALEAARDAYARGQATVAREMFEGIVTRHPDLAEPHVYLARLARERGERSTAVSELERAIRLEPRNALAQREMGNYLLQIGNPELARRFYVRAIELNPDDRTAMGWLGCALLRLGRLPEAQRWSSRAGPGAWTACPTL